MSNEEYYGKILYNKQMSEDWLSLLEDAPAFNRFDSKPITALLSAPCDLGTLVLREEEHSFHDRGTLETLRSFYQTHRFFDYSMTRRCFKVIDGFSSYKVPFVNWHFALCPLESPENGMWVNPLEVYQLQTIRGVCFAELRNGVIIELLFKSAASSIKLKRRFIPCVICGVNIRLRLIIKVVRWIIFNCRSPLFFYHYGNVPFSRIGSRIEVFFIRGI